MQKTIDQNPDRRLSAKEVSELCGIGLSTTWKWAADGRLPKPQRYGNRCSRWRLADVLEALDQAG